MENTISNMVNVHDDTDTGAGVLQKSRADLNDNSFDLLFHTLYFFRFNTYYISFSDYSKYRVKVSTWVDKFCQLFHMYPIS